MNDDTETAIPPIPAKVAAAICAVMGDVPKLGKGERNQHGNYNFASIDDFLEAVRPLCAKHGLIIMQDEESFDMKEGQNKRGEAVRWLLMRFRFTLAHTSGETWAHRPSRTIMVDASMGSQAFGAAQSYVLKQFERSLFQIATGEKDVDADAHPAADLPQANRPAARKATATKGGETGATTPEGDKVIAAIVACETLAALELWGSMKAKDAIAALSQPEQDRARRAFADRRGQFAVAA